MRLLVIATLLLSSISSYAAADYTQFFWQADAGKTYLIPRLDYGNGDIDVGAASVDLTITNLSLLAEHGLNEDMSVGGGLILINNKQKFLNSTIKVSGLGDLRFYLRAKNALSSGILRYGADLYLSPEDSKQEANGDYNAYSGRHTVTPYIGLETSIDTLTFGGELSYKLGLTDTKEVDNTGAETKTSGKTNTAIALFLETAHS